MTVTTTAAAFIVSGVNSVKSVFSNPCSIASVLLSMTIRWEEDLQHLIAVIGNVDERVQPPVPVCNRCPEADRGNHGRERGINILKRMVNSLAPSILADSAISSGMD